MRAWVVRAGRHGEREQQALKEGVVLVGWDQVDDLGNTVNRDDVKVAVAAAYPDASSHWIGNVTGQLHRFRHEIAEGDLMLLPLRSGTVAVGRVAGGYEYRPEGGGSSFPHVRRVEWLLKDVDRGRFHNDLLGSMASYLTVFELSRFGAVERIAKVSDGETDPGRPDVDEFAATLTEPADLFDAAHQRSDGQPLTLSIRDFLAVWDAPRRSAASVEQIEGELAEQALATEPPFTEGSLDTSISVIPRLVSDGEQAEDDAYLLGMSPEERGLGAGAGVSYKISNLDAANRPPEYVRASDSLQSAMTRMVLRGYSQLPVLDSHDRLRGVVSWESIGRARMADPHAELEAAVNRAREAERSDDLLDWVGEIQQTGFVMVRDRDHKVCGLITAADLALQFGTRVRPFVLLEEIEQRLRRAVDPRISPERLRAAARGSSRVKSAADLTFGNYGYLLKESENWDALGWSIDQGLFLQELEQCRQFRNDLMHFSPDPITEDQLGPVQGMLDLLRSLDPQS